jgi:hypothetical protein
LPFAGLTAQSATDGVHQDLIRLFRQFMMIPEAMLEEIPLSIHTVATRHEFLPVGNRLLHAWQRRKCEYGVQMVRHEQA